MAKGRGPSPRPPMKANNEDRRRQPVPQFQCLPETPTPPLEFTATLAEATNGPTAMFVEPCAQTVALSSALLPAALTLPAASTQSDAVPAIDGLALDEYHPFHAASAGLLRRAGRRVGRPRSRPKYDEPHR